MITVDRCGICFKELIRGDYVYGACHDCAKRAISQRLKDVKSYAAIRKRVLLRNARCPYCELAKWACPRHGEGE